jgi:hypothetical protein
VYQLGITRAPREKQLVNIFGLITFGYKKLM